MKKKKQEIPFELLPDYIKEAYYIQSNADLKAMGILIGAMVLFFGIIMLFIGR